MPELELVPLLGVLTLGLGPLPEVLGLGSLLGVLAPELVALLGVLELELELDPLFDVPLLVLDPLFGEPLGDGPGLLVGGVVCGGAEGELAEVVGCGDEGVAVGEVGCACAPDGVEVGALAGEVAHGGTEVDIRAIVGMSGLVEPAPGGCLLIMAACAVRDCGRVIPRLPAGSAELEVGEGVSDAHCGPRFEPSGDGEGATAEELGLGDGPGPADPGVGAG